MRDVKLILVIGVAGSGKTTLSREIAQRMGVLYLDNNFIVDPFFPHTRTGPEYLKLRPRFYEVLYAIAEQNLTLGNSVLLDVPHVKEVRSGEWRAFIERLAEKTNAQLVIVKCVCSVKTLHERLQGRGEPRDRWKLDHWKRFLREQPPDVSVPFRHLTVNTEKSLRANVEAAIAHIVGPVV